MSLAVVDPATGHPERDCFEALQARHPGRRMHYHLPALEGFASLEAVGRPHAPAGLTRQLGGVLVFGSAASVHDALPWQARLVEWLRPLAASGTPIFGICYGHQLLAWMFGGEVGFVNAEQRKLKGGREVHIEDAVWGLRSGELVVSHRECVTRAPADFEAVAQSDLSSLEGLAHRSLPIRSLQAHPEATPGFCARNDVPYAGRFDFGHSLCDAFVDQVFGP